MALKEGDKHGFLTAVRKLDRAGAHRSYNWLFRCDCGSDFICRGDRVVTGNTVGCPQCRKARISEKSTHHGACANESVTRLYSIWRNMRHRCRVDGTPSPTERSYHSYGGRGIRVCDEWHEFPAFRDWALANGYADDLTIERRDVDDHYRPGNCEWITRAENIKRAMAVRPVKKLSKGARMRADSPSAVRAVA